MHLGFTLETLRGPRPLSVELDRLVIAGWAGRDPTVVEHHVAELAAIGVPRPSAVPLFYRVAGNQLLQDESVQVVGPASAGEIEPFVFAAAGELYVTVASDHTDRALERQSVALAKQLCAKPVARTAWLLAEVEEHWDELELRATIVEGDREVLYQADGVASLRTPRDLIARLTANGSLPDGTGMACGTVGVIGSIRPAAAFIMELVDPRLGRSIRHRYDVAVLDEVR